MQRYYTSRFFLADLVGFVVYFTLYGLFTWYEHQFRFLAVFTQALIFSVIMSLMFYWARRRKGKVKAR